MGTVIDSNQYLVNRVEKLFLYNNMTIYKICYCHEMYIIQFWFRTSGIMNSILTGHQIQMGWQWAMMIAEVEERQLRWFIPLQWTN